MTSLPESFSLNPSWLRDARTTGEDPESDYGPSKVIGQRQPGN